MFNQMCNLMFNLVRASKLMFNKLLNRSTAQLNVQTVLRTHWALKKIRICWIRNRDPNVNEIGTLLGSVNKLHRIMCSSTAAAWQCGAHARPSRACCCCWLLLWCNPPPPPCCSYIAMLLQHGYSDAILLYGHPAQANSSCWTTMLQAPPPPWTACSLNIVQPPCCSTGIQLGVEIRKVEAGKRDWGRTACSVPMCSSSMMLNDHADALLCHINLCMA